jgi:hypothetical protein
MSTGGQRRGSSPAPLSQDKLVDLRMRARYHRDRHRLYLARTSGSRPTSRSKLEELKRDRELAESRLRRAERGDRKK